MEITQFFEKDLDKLIEEISLFKNEEDVWKTKKGISNSAGNLTLHLIGNLNYFIGTALGHTNYIRNRDKEFSLKNIPREKLIEDLKELPEMIGRTLSKISDDEAKITFPWPVNDKELSIQNMMIHLLAHLNYHLGQINYLRRILG
ncbi:MAG: DinB family protein [Bacteroidota bacterium]|nr:DinB family protein [Bacteroidota bacterium]